MSKPMVSCLTATHGRISWLKEAFSCFLAQDYENKELIILNNHPTPIEVRRNYPGVVIFNEPRYLTLGACRKRLFELAEGDLIRTWDDDDLYLPWAISQGVECIGDAPAFKPELSWHSTKNKIYRLEDNVFEAAMTTQRWVVEKYGYQATGGNEHEPLLEGVQKEGGCARKMVRPSYVYRWDTPLHRISGTLGNGRTEVHRSLEWMEANQDVDGELEETVLTHYWGDIKNAEEVFLSDRPDIKW